MKKIMIAAAIVCAAAFANAAAFDWKSSTMASSKFYNNGTSDLVTAATCYLFDAATYTQADFLNAKGADLSKSLATGAIANGVVSPTVTLTDYGSVGVQTSFWMAIVADDDLFYVSAVKPTAGVEGKNATLSFAGTNSKNAFTAWNEGDTFSAAGWYQTVPEPTSGLLMLLGMAGLALRRRRA